jgi:CheY-like chemotaxis protein
MKIENKGLEFIIEIAPHIPGSLLLEEVRLRQVLFNLIGNAVKFTEEGYIKLYVKKIDTSQDKSTLDLVVGVEDTGIGIPAESQQKIFDAFKQQDGQSAKKYGGTGLGLAITKRLVEMMGGELSLKSEVNNGSTFEFTLHNVTVAAAGPAAEAARTFDQELISFEPTLILVVDDIETNRLLIREFLINRDFTVIEAINGKEAVELAKEYKPAVVLMDIKMPVMDGYEAAAEMKKDKDLAAIPVIALTASAMKGDREKVLEKGFDGFLHKPVQVSDLFRELARFIGTTVTDTDTDTGTAVGPGKGKKKRKKKETGKRVSGEPVKIPNEAVKRLPAVLETLETESTDLWKTARKSGFFNEVMDFGKHIRSLGEENQLPLLTEFGDELINHANNFDIEKMNASLGAFPRLIEEIKHFSDKRAPA